MSLRKLYDAFCEMVTLPIEVDEVRDAIVDLGVQDEIKFIPIPMDTGDLLGIFHQYIRREGVYAEPLFCSIIVYPEGIDTPLQRIICCKELVHLMDSAVEKVSTKGQVTDLVEKLLGPMSTEDIGLADFVAAQDKMAVYRCIPLLFPAAARAEAIAKFKSGEKTLEEIAAWASLPKQIVELVMDAGWPELEKIILDC